MTITPLPPESLYRRCDPAQFNFASTAEIDGDNKIIGQARAVEAIRFGLGMRRKGYNLFLLGPSGTGKQAAVRRLLDERAPSEPTPDDWCYVYNFEQRDRPRALRLPPGKATIFAQAMKTLVRELSSVLPAVLGDEEAVSAAIAPLFDELQQPHQSLLGVIGYLEQVRQDVVSNVENFLQEGRPDAPQTALTRYQVNVFVDHSQTEGAPVMMEYPGRYQNIIGRVEHVSYMGTLLTDFTHIKPGALHLANGGYLLLDAHQVQEQSFSWDVLKNALRSEQIRIESLDLSNGASHMASLEPEPIPLDIKVILLGERWLYSRLSGSDLGFPQLFKVLADFEDKMIRDETTSLAHVRMVASQVRHDGLRHFDQAAVARVLEHSSRLAEDQEKLTADIQSVRDLLQEADYWAGAAGHNLVETADVQKALDMRRYRHGRARDAVYERILRETSLLATGGEAVGQINGLFIYPWGDFTYGAPDRITGRIRVGSGNVEDIERQVNFGTPIYGKAVLLLTAYLKNHLAAERPFSLTATLTVDGSHTAIDGNSASSAELYVLLSALANAPIKQSFAVTGAVSQWGEVLAIGRVNEKIESFFDICKARGLTGDQGVLIPQANARELMLRADVVEAAAAGQFHIYAVPTIDEGITLLTGIPAGELDENGEYPEDSINGRVVARLLALDEKQRSFGNSSKNNNKTTADTPDENPEEEVEDEQKIEEIEEPGDPDDPDK